MASNLSFEEVASISGIDYVGQSYGASWGNFNGDDYPDLWVTNHSQQLGTLYHNLGNGTFEDISNKVSVQKLNSDRHGAAWADFDNDGDQDLIQLVGAGRGVGAGSNQMYVNEGGILEDRARKLGIDYPLSRGRNPLWFDFDQDGLLDLFLGAVPRADGQAPPTIFRQTESGFEDVRLDTGFTLGFSEFGFLSDLTGDNKLDGVFNTSGNNVSGVITYDLNPSSFENVTSSLISDSINRVSDIVSGDFNNDLKPDLYLTPGEIESDLVQDDSNNARARILSRGDQKGIRFDSSENVRFNFNFNFDLSLSDIYIGANGFNPDNMSFVLSSSDLDVEGIFPHTPGVDRGVYIGYDSNQQHWQMLVSSPDKFDLSTLINTTEPIFDLTGIGFAPNTVTSTDQLLINTEQGLVDRSPTAGIDAVPIAGQSVATGDLDNDMDLDLYVVATGTAGNRPNVLYENQGDGTFVAVTDAAGAEGTNLGIGDSVVTADYDLDGFLDLFVTNGNGIQSLNKNAPYQLFRNQGNDNNWLEIDLEGTVSNRDGIGAQVFVTAGGVTQLREQSGGIHNKSQNHQRLHFGLADNTQVDEILVKWPNGQEQTINNIAANQLLEIVESSESFYGQPEYNPSEESGIFIWKEDREDSWHLRVTAGEDLNRRYVGSIIADSPAISVEEIGIESHDLVNISDPSRIDFDLRVWSGFQDGIDFSFSKGASLTLNLENPGAESSDLLRLGAEQWSTNDFPVDLGDW